MDKIDINIKRMVIEFIKVNLETGDSLTLSKVKALRKFKINNDLGFLITEDEEYKKMKKSFLNSQGRLLTNHRFYKP